MSFAIVGGRLQWVESWTAACCQCGDGDHERGCEVKQKPAFAELSTVGAGAARPQFVYIIDAHFCLTVLRSYCYSIL